MGRLIGLLLVLNMVILVAGLSMEHVRSQPATLVDFNADKVRLLGRVERGAGNSAVARDADVERHDATPLPAEATVPPPHSRCVTWPGLDDSLLAEIEALLRGAGISDAHVEIRLEKRLGWWVYLPPFANAEAARSAVEAARAKGVADIAVVRGGALANAVSLGAFPSLVKARAQLARVRSLGVMGAQAGPRPDSGPVRVILDDSVPEASVARLGTAWGKGRAPVACVGN